jgi:hypothetical protein
MGSSARRGAALLLGIAVGCAVSAPVATVLAPLDPKLDRVVYVTTNRSREDVVASLRRGGFAVVSDARDTSVVVAVQLGSVRDHDPRCGTLQNVTYTVYQGGVRTSVIRGRGWTGASCEPTIFAQMNAVLFRLFGPGSAPPGEEGAPPPPGPHP